VTQASQSALPSKSENATGLLCYLLGWVTGIIFLVIDKRPYVRFHAVQSIVVFGGLSVLGILVRTITGAGFNGYGEMAGNLGSFFLGWVLYGLIGLVALVFWLLLVVKAYNGERFQLPVAASIAQRVAR
jgi:uncharacterized membrane protein